jgi:hypothetical protein
VIDVDGLPPIPLTDAQLRPLLEHGDVVDVWLPAHRPPTVYTLAGEHRGDVLEFYVETPDRFVRFVYEPGDRGGLRWRSAPAGIPKDPDEDDTIPDGLAVDAVDRITTEYDRLGRVATADRGGTSA